MIENSIEFYCNGQYESGETNCERTNEKGFVNYPQDEIDAPLESVLQVGV
jgi:hypothetical protein